MIERKRKVEKRKGGLFGKFGISVWKSQGETRTLFQRVVKVLCGITVHVESPNFCVEMMEKRRASTEKSGVAERAEI